MAVRVSAHFTCSYLIVVLSAVFTRGSSVSAIKSLTTLSDASLVTSKFLSVYAPF